jgi:hypothetical protein
MVFSRMVDKTNFMCRSPKGTLCEGWMLFPARSNPLRGLEIASSGTERPPRNDTRFLEKVFPVKAEDSVFFKRCYRVLRKYLNQNPVIGE